MKISIVTVVYNCVDYIEDCLGSIVNQAHVDLEYIVIDGGSTDGTLDILNQHEDKIDILISEPDRGIYDAMNKGIRLANGEVIGILNSDDFYRDANVLRDVITLFDDPIVDLVYSDISLVQPATLQTIRRWSCGAQQSFLRGWHPPHPGLFVRKRVYDAYGAYHSDLKIAADFEFMLRTFEKEGLRAAHLSRAIVSMRMGGASTKSLSSITQGYKEIRKAFQRNGMRMPIDYPFYRYFPKIAEVARRKWGNS